MSPPLHVVEAAERFWSGAGMECSFPLDVRRAVARSLPIAIVLLPNLNVARAEEWLQRQAKAIAIGVDDRPLRACLIAQSGAGFIIVDGADPEREQRYSIAHELAHFLHDYLAPRRSAVARLGEGILEVLDGARPARPEERTVALLTGAAVQRHVHLMGRHEDFSRTEDINRSESIADALAVELLAPWDLVSRYIAELGIGQNRSAISHLLMDRYALPEMPAARYAALLSPGPAPTSRLLRHVRLVADAADSRNTS